MALNKLLLGDNQQNSFNKNINELKVVSIVG